MYQQLHRLRAAVNSFTAANPGSLDETQISDMKAKCKFDVPDAGCLYFARKTNAHALKPGDFLQKWITLIPNLTPAPSQVGLFIIIFNLSNVLSSTLVFQPVLPGTLYRRYRIVFLIHYYRSC